MCGIDVSDVAVTIVFLSFDDGCHNEPSFLMSQVKRLQPLVKRPFGNSYGVTNSYALVEGKTVGEKR